MNNLREKTQTILIVDDAEFCRKIIGAALTVIGYKINAAKDGSEAVKFIKQHAHNLDLIILDLKMPGLSGIDVLNMVQTEIKKYNLPILVLTGTVRDREEILSLRKLGVAGYLNKTDPPEYFIEKVQTALQKFRV